MKTDDHGFVCVTENNASSSEVSDLHKRNRVVFLA